MARFNRHFHTASGALATSGMRSRLEATIPVPPEAEQNYLPAKQRGLSRPNNIEELRLKRRRRNKRLRERQRKESKNTKQRRLEEKIKRNIREEFKATTRAAASQMTEMRSKADYFWRRWREEKSLRTTSHMSIHRIDPANLKECGGLHVDNNGEIDNKICKGTFGICVKKMYRGFVVAVKQFKSYTSKSDVEKEAMMINSFDHPGLPFLFGINIQSKPYILVTEFYGIGGQCVTIGHAVKKLSLEAKEWAFILEKCSGALAHIHEKGFIHRDIKQNNIILQNSTGVHEPVIIDFGKMKKAEHAKIYKLNSKEQDRYLKYYKHIAPEIIWGRSAPSPASDIYSFGQIVSLVVYYTKAIELQKIAKKCIHGTPEKRPKAVNIALDFKEVSNN